MNINSGNYVKAAVRTDVPDYAKVHSRLDNIPVLRLLHSVIGLQTEVGELADILKRYMFYGTPIDWQHVKEEFGDCSWYHALGVDVLVEEAACGSLDDVLQENVEKLLKRYPDKFSEEAAVERADKNSDDLLEASEN